MPQGVLFAGAEFVFAGIFPRLEDDHESEKSLGNDVLVQRG